VRVSCVMGVMRSEAHRVDREWETSRERR
jgi:hypothetical protein